MSKNSYLIKQIKLFDTNKDFTKNSYHDVLIENGKIKQIDHDINVIGYEIINGNQMILTPGFIDSHSHVGMVKEFESVMSSDVNERFYPNNRLHLQAIDGTDLFNEHFYEAAKEGITTIVNTPGSAFPVGGWAANIKTAGEIENRVINSKAGIKLSVGNSPTEPSSQKPANSNIGVFALVRDCLEQIKLNKNKDPNLEKIKNKNLPIYVHISNTGDIYNLIRLKREYDFYFVIVHGGGGTLLAETLKQEGIDVIHGPILQFRHRLEYINVDFKSAINFTQSGHKSAFTLDFPVQLFPLFRMLLIWLIQNGLPHQDAMDLVTINPAKIMKIEQQIGSIEPGKDADLVLWSNDPFDLRSHVLMTLINGEIVYTNK